MFIRAFQFLIIITSFTLSFTSCKQNGESRTNVRTTDIEIPKQPPVQPKAQVPSPDITDAQLFREACLEGKEEVVNQYIVKGMDINLADEDGRTALMLAAFNGHAQIVEKLIQNGAEINRTDSSGRTSLMYGSTGHFPETVKLLLLNGAETNITDEDEHFTALMFAGAEGNVEVILLLLEHGADPNLQDKDGDTAESFARQNGHEEAADLLKSVTESKN